MRHQKRHLQGFDAYTTTLVRLVDVGAVFIAGWLSYMGRFGHLDMPERYLWALPLGALLILLIMPNLGVYTSWRGRVRALLVLRLIAGYFLVGAGLALIMFLSKSGASFSRLWVTFWILGACALSILTRAAVYPLLNRLRMSGRNRRSVLLVGDAHSCATAVAHLKRHPEAGFDVRRVLVIDADRDRDRELEAIPHEPYRIGDPLEHEEKEVWICLPLARGEAVRDIQASLSLSTGNVRYMPDMGDFRLINHNVSNVADLFLLDLSCSPISGGARLLKRAEDAVLSSIILLCISPILLVVALGVRLSSPGPIFYRQERVGLNGRPFMMLKFRSMPVDSEKNGVQWGGARDKQVTRFGAFIRKTSLDELPQFINVLKGDMSIVGPRPERTLFVERFKHEIPGYMQKHMVKAGITGWAQINGWRGDTDLAKRIECDLWYIENWSVWLDLKIVFLTIFKGFVNQHAY
jgi:putative colanic acid biosynthesis UDP-glucose lipid carrier transferase